MTDIVARFAAAMLAWISATASLACDNVAASPRRGDAGKAASEDAPSTHSSGLEEAAAKAARARLGEEEQPCQRIGERRHYSDWVGLEPFGVASVPTHLERNREPQEFVVHFHGQLAALAELDAAESDLALIGVSFEQGTYESRLVEAPTFEQWLASPRDKLPGARWAERPLAMTAWSNGYEAIRHLLLMDAVSSHAIVLLDGLHSAEPEDVGRTQLAPFVDWARQAARGQRFMFISHSTIDTYGYSSTSESVDLLLDELGLDLAPLEGPTLGGEAPIRALHQEGLFILGYSGEDRDAHCRHLALLVPALELARAWDRAR